MRVPKKKTCQGKRLLETQQPQVNSKSNVMLFWTHSGYPASCACGATNPHCHRLRLHCPPPPPLLTTASTARRLSHLTQRWHCWVWSMPSALKALPAFVESDGPVSCRKGRLLQSSRQHSHIVSVYGRTALRWTSTPIPAVDADLISSWVNYGKKYVSKNCFKNHFLRPAMRRGFSFLLYIFT